MLRKRSTCNLDDLLNTIYNSPAITMETLLKDNANLRDSSGRSLIHKAVIESDMEKLNDLVRVGCNINAPDNKGNSPLHLAIVLDNAEAVKTLLRLGADAKQETPQTSAYLKSHISTPLHQAMVLDGRERYKMIEALLKHDCDTSAVLHQAISKKELQMVNLLLRYNADVNEVDSVGFTPLGLACIVEDCSIVDSLLQHGARVNQTTKPDEFSRFEFSPLVVCCMCHTDKTITQLLLHHGANPDMGQSHKIRYRCFVPICIASREGDLGLAKLLIYQNCQLNWTVDGHLPGNPNMYHTSPLKFALLNGHKELVKLLIQAGCQILSCSKTRSLLYSALRDDTSAFTTWYKDYTSQPISLSHICRLKLRHHFGFSLHAALDQLQLPKRLSNMILLQDLLNS